MKSYERKLIGRREIVNFPDLDLFQIEAKIDTGAYTSAIHCKSVKKFTKGEKEMISFCLLDPDHPSYEDKIFEWPLFKVKKIKNSFGQQEERYIIKTKLGFFDELYEVEISLADRSLMEYPLLLGRKAIRKKFIVDVSKIHYAPKNKTILLK